MEFVVLNEQGFAFSRIIQGFWRMNDWNRSIREHAEYMQQLMDLGITTWDNADIYGDYSCEEMMGRAWKESGIPRDRVQLVTKCGIKLVSQRRPEHSIKSYDTSTAHIVRSVENSLKMLRTDYIDVLLIHRPDPLMDANEVAETFEKLRNSGKVRYFGVSNFTVSQMQLLQSRCSFSLITNQIEFSLYCLEPLYSGILDYMQEKRIYPMIWSPFAGGSVFRDPSERGNRIRETLTNLAEKYQCSPEQIIIAWLILHPARLMPILGTGKIERVRQAVEALHLGLSREDWFVILKAATGQDVP